MLNEKSQIMVALFKKQDNGEFKPVYSYVENFADDFIIQGGYRKTANDSAFALENDAENQVIGDLDRLDLANYRLNADTTAFGVRYSTNVGYSGGGAINQAITLFAVIDDKLQPVLQAPTYSYRNIAGDWNKDGTRQHDIEERENILKIAPSMTNGFADIILQEKGKKKPSRIYKWHENLKRYQ